MQPGNWRQPGNLCGVTYYSIFANAKIAMSSSQKFQLSQNLVSFHMRFPFTKVSNWTTMQTLVSAKISQYIPSTGVRIAQSYQKYKHALAPKVPNAQCIYQAAQISGPNSVRQRHLSMARTHILRCWSSHSRRAFLCSCVSVFVTSYRSNGSVNSPSAVRRCWVLLAAIRMSRSQLPPWWDRKSVV